MSGAVYEWIYISNKKKNILKNNKDVYSKCTSHTLPFILKTWDILNFFFILNLFFICFKLPFLKSRLKFESLHHQPAWAIIQSV